MVAGFNAGESYTGMSMALDPVYKRIKKDLRSDTWSENARGIKKIFDTYMREGTAVISSATQGGPVEYYCTFKMLKKNKYCP